MHLPLTLCKAFELTALTKEGEITLMSTDCNIKRAHHIELPDGTEVHALSLKIISNWGGSDKTNVISFDF